MANLTNDGLVQDFLSRRNSYGYNSGDTFHFDNDFLYSYNTLIAKYDVDKNILFIADSNFSPTTSKHRGLAISEAFKRGIKVVNIPLAMNGREFPTNNAIIDRLEARMDNYSLGTDLALADNRRQFLLTYERYVEFIELIGGEKPKNFNKYLSISNKLEDKDFIKGLQKQRREFLANKDEVFRQTVTDRKYFS